MVAATETFYVVWGSMVLWLAAALLLVMWRVSVKRWRPLLAVPWDSEAARDLLATPLWHEVELVEREDGRLRIMLDWFT